MDFFEAHIAEILIVGITLWIVFKNGKITSAKDEAELAVAGLSAEENWSSVQEISIRRKINIDTTLERIELVLSFIAVLLLFMAFKLI